MAEIINNECVVQCKNCGKSTTAKWHKGLFKKGWQLTDTKGSCPACRMPIKIKGIETALCPHCHKLVEKTENNICLNCKKHLSTPVFRTKVECPECGVMQGIPESHQGDYACQVCGTMISAQIINKNAGKTAVETEQYIKLPDVARMQQEGWAIWKHPMHSFPFKSRMQVNEGTYGVFLQNGVCKDSCAPGDYLLENSSLDRSQKFDAALQADDVVFNVDIYCVLQDLPEITWGVSTHAFSNMEKTATYSAGGNGRIVLRVCDAAAYIRHLGFKAATMDSFMYTNKEPNTGDGQLVQLVRDLLSEAVFSSLQGQPADKLGQLVPNLIKDQVVREMDKRLAELGLCVKEMRLNELLVKQTAQSEAAEKVYRAIRTEQSWSAQAAHLFVPGLKEQHAMLDFSGRYRIRIADEARCFGLPEMQSFLQQPDEEKIKAFIQSKVNTLLQRELPVVAQQALNNGSINDLLETIQYPSAISTHLMTKLNNTLTADGLVLDTFDMQLPRVVNKSAALQSSLELPQKKQSLKKAVESLLPLDTKPIRVHDKNDKSIYVDISFACKLGMRIQNEESFYQLSEVQSLLKEDAQSIEKRTIDHYTSRLEPIFQEVIARILQSMVDQTTADIRELHRFTAILKQSLRTSLDDRVNPWGLAVESLDMDELRQISHSKNLDGVAQAEQVKSGISLQQEIDRIQNSHQIFTAEESVRVQSANMDVSDQLLDKQEQMKLRQQEREYAYKMSKLQKEDDLDKLTDDIMKSQQEREAQAVLERYRRAYQLKEEQIRAANQADSMQLEASIQLSLRQQQAEFEKKLNDAENQRALNEIMRKIDESNLSWKEKLDEYDRLRRLTAAKEAAEIAHVQADTDIRIERDKNDLYYQTETTKIQLSAQQAKLLEEMKGYEEQRQERIKQATADREERRAILSFEQRLQERKEQAAQQMEQLHAQYAQALAMREKDVDLQKLIKQLEAGVALGGFQADTDKAKARAEADAAIARSQAEAKRLDEHMAREESMATRAMELKKTILDMQHALEILRLENAKNQDNRMAEVAISANQALKRKEESSVDTRLNSLARKMDGIVASYKQLEQQVKELKDRFPWWVGGVRPPVYPPYPLYSVNSQQPGVMTTMPCPLCKQEIPSGTKVCPYCSTPVL